MSSSQTTLAEIPTISLLYKLGRLGASSTSTVIPSQQLNQTISLIRSDITKLRVGAIVNAANESLLGGGGVDGAIHRAAGRELYRECRTLDGCNTGSAKITDAYSLPCEKVIHAVGPIYWSTKQEGKNEQLLRGCYRKALQLAVENGIRSIAFSSLSTGVYGYPSGEAAETALSEVKDFLEGEDGHKLDKVIFVVFEMKDVRAYETFIPEFFPPTISDLTQDKSAKDNGDGDEESEGADRATKGKESAKKEKAEDARQSKEAAAVAAKLPDAPTKEPNEEGEPDSKKTKISHDDEDDWEEIDANVESAANGPATGAGGSTLKS
ncbi:MAG: hypothetical protein M1814_003028 [Vezdaea aestivalis]|nr:MAG: hypothetical protein M1814_003028 [Vezdaea aestivalis]